MPTEDPLAQLRDLHLPTEPGWWPPAIGWWLLLVAVIIFLVFAVRWIYHHWQVNRWRKIARIELKNIRALPISEPQKIITQCSILLRRIVLALDSRESVAALSGNEWLQHLDALSKSAVFTEKMGRLLLESQYQSPAMLRKNVSQTEVTELCDVVERVIKRAGKRKAGKQQARSNNNA